MIVVVQTKNGLWIGADSVRGSDRVCKVHETSFGIVAKDGKVEGFDQSGTHYSIDREIHELVSSAHSAQEFRVAIRDRYVADIFAQMAWLLNDPQADAKTIMSETFGMAMPEITTHLQERSLLLVTNERGVLKLQHLVLGPASDPLPGGKFRYFVLSPLYPAPPDWLTISADIFPRDQDRKHPSLKQFGLVVNYTRDDSWIRSHPEKAIREVLQLATVQFAGEVGPPYSLVRVLPSSASLDESIANQIVTKWISKGKCPSWTYSIPNHPELTDRY